MLQKLSIFQLAGDLARHSAARQSVIARNLANMDTPGFKAQDITGFQDHLAQASQGSASSNSLKVSRPSHIGQREISPQFRASAASDGEQKPNGNTVSLEVETLRAIEAERAHSRALAIYQSSLTILKTSLGRGR